MKRKKERRKTLNIELKSQLGINLDNDIAVARRKMNKDLL